MRDHQARRLETRFRLLFYLAGLEPLWPVKSEDQKAAVWRVAREVRSAADAAGFATEHLAEERDLGVNWGPHLWHPSDKIARNIDHVREWLLDGFPSLRRKGSDGEGVGLFEALAKGEATLREHLRQHLRSRPISAHISFEHGAAELLPDPRNLLDVAWILVAELLEGGWPIRSCAAPECGRYIGQWTRRERLFCNEGCRTAYHNAQRRPGDRPRGRPRRVFPSPSGVSEPGRRSVRERVTPLAKIADTKRAPSPIPSPHGRAAKRASVPRNVPAATRNRPKTTQRQPTRKRKTR